MSDPAVRIVFLGGLGEIGRNCLCLEVEDRILLVDCGLMFPDENMPGVDLVLPDFTYLRENADRVEGVFLTHAHEDHAGGLAFLLRDMELKIYGSALSLAMARNRIEESGLIDRATFIPVFDGERRSIGPFDCQFVPVTHSVPHGFAIAFFTPAGTIVHTGDFKLDLTPVDGRHTNLALLGEIARMNGGVRLLLSDSTNAERPGFTASESTVGEAMRTLVREHADRRLIVACFASHLHRIEQVAAAIGGGRKIAFLGRSMIHNVAMARELGLLDVPAHAIIDIEEASRYAPGEVCIICTGSQGEPMSALSLMAAHEHKHVKVSDDDVVVLSAHAIPGNESNVSRHRRVAPRRRRGRARRQRAGARLRSRVAGRAQVHAEPALAGVVRSGARRVSPSGASRAPRAVGVPAEKVLVCEDGDVVTLGPAGLDVERRAVPAGYTYVDGIVGDVGRGVLRDRRALSEEGVVVVIVTVDAQTGAVLNGPEIVTRGWVYAPEAEELLEEAKQVVLAALEGAVSEGRPTSRRCAATPQVARSFHRRPHAPASHRHPGGDGGLTQ